ncbi:Alcohol dehydrogenase GroES-like domain-containing protein [Mesorhizobium muleiense]|uniref:Alcohol dehydrogenase GroES-like domain-containing protein n=2 Tax=Mesorhizobium muleiense TaxID=1004279 RepID=A0A1G9AN32_9HYPH|nr:Alcohol dehydrogenase GroES-like domain-containing protein [Mesorhizobium muleiense]
MRNAKPDTMQAAAIDRFGGAELVTVRAVPVPEVGPSDVLIRVEVAGVASWDALEREGLYDGAFGMPSTFPYVLGWDCAGAVVAVGSQVSRFKEGDRVYAASMPLPKGGTYATYAVTDADNVSLIPAKLTIEQAGVMGWDALTALSGLEEIGLKQGDTMMIFGASGGIGHMAIQNDWAPAYWRWLRAMTAWRYRSGWAPTPSSTGARTTWSRPLVNSPPAASALPLSQ